MRISNREIDIMNNFFEEMYMNYGQGLDSDSWKSEAWITYLELRKYYGRSFYQLCGWDQIYLSLCETIGQLRKARNYMISIESKMSLNQSYTDSGTEIGCIIKSSESDFSKYTELWDFAYRLGNIKYNILRLLYEGEEDYEIQRIMKLSVDDYNNIREELKWDFKNYIK